jgi:hypothetical protein
MLWLWIILSLLLAELVLAAIWAVLWQNYHPAGSRDKLLRTLRNLACGGVVLGLVAITAAAFETYRFKSKAITAEGTVIELIRVAGDDNDTFAPRVQFKDTSGTEHTFRARSSSYPAAYTVGEKVRVLFDPKAPETARLDAPIELWGLPFAISIVTMASFVAAAFLHSRMNKVVR